MTLVIALAPLLTGVVRKAKARLTQHRGASVFELIRDLALVPPRKEVVIAHNASWLFRVAPYVIFATTWVAAALVPTFGTGLLFSWSADLIAIIALLGGGALLHWRSPDSTSALSFGGIGSSREVMIASLAEPAMLMIVFTLCARCGLDPALDGCRLHAVAAGRPARLARARLSFALIIVGIAENARIPVDNPTTHLELTMVHEAMVLEYSGRHLAMIELAVGAQAPALHLPDRLRVHAVGPRPGKGATSVPDAAGVGRLCA